jgi:hypothetical protein
MITAYYSADGRCSHKIRDRLAKASPAWDESDHLEIAFIVQDVPRPILLLRTKLSDFFDERGVLVITPINGHIFGQPGRQSSEAVHRLCFYIPGNVDERAASSYQTVVSTPGATRW